MSASIDRRIEVVNDSGDRAAIQHVSDLRSLPFVVVLGEPGIGKSTVFEREAALAGGKPVKVRQFMTSPTASSGSALFLDGLDEYRSDGSSSDKAHGLAAALVRANPARWRLSCRSEDWRKEADIEALRATTNGEAIVVAQLLPLDETEAAAILTSLGEQNPEAFLSKAESLGAHGFIESPLSLKLLHRAVADGGTWPTTRFSLFGSAIQRLAFERNREHTWGARHSPEAIVSAAADTCLLFLASGARAIWVSNDEPPVDAGDSRAHLSLHDLGIDRDLFGDTLDTPIFRGDGEAFEPIHRTVAEYLAGLALARAVVGAPGRSAIPLARALALITGTDGRAPTELRGLYAWFAAHLAKLGDEAGAMCLIEADATTVLTYGDAAMFSTAGRRAILANLGRSDPYFLGTLGGVTAFGGLAGEDIASEFAAILNGPADGTHRQVTAFEVLTNGRSIASLRPLLRAIALDPSRAVSERCRAADAWLNGVADRSESQRELFDACSSEGASAGRSALRVHLVADLPPERLSTADIKEVLSEFDSNTSGRLYGLRKALEETPRPEIFDEPIQEWLGDGYPHEVESFLDKVFVAAVGKTAVLTAARLWRWTVNIRTDAWSPLRRDCEKAVREWISRADGRECEFFEAILSDEDRSLATSVVRDAYILYVGKPPSTDIVRLVLAKAAAATSAEENLRLLWHAMSLVSLPTASVDAYWETYEVVSGQAGLDDLLKRLQAEPVPEWPLNQRRHAERRARAAEEARRKAVAQLTPLLAELRVGLRAQALGWAAQRYLEPVPNTDDRPVGVDGVRSSTDETVAEAILAGWEHLVTKELPGMSASILGKAEVGGSIYNLEFAVVAGLDHLHEVGRIPDLETSPMAVAIVVLRSESLVRDSARRARLRRWTTLRLNRAPDEGATELVVFWNAALDAGAKRLTGAWELLEDASAGDAAVQALQRLLQTRRVLPVEVLRSAVHLLAKVVPLDALLDVAMRALEDSSVVGDVRKQWNFVALLLDPKPRWQSFGTEYGDAEIASLYAEASEEGLLEELNRRSETARTERDAMTVLLLGRTTSPDEERVGGRVMRRMPLSDTVRTAIGWLGSQRGAAARLALASLVDNADLAAWRPSLLHAESMQARVHRDSAFKHPVAAQIRTTIAGGDPANAADLRAVVVEALRRLSRELHTADTTPWKRYWNTNPSGKVTQPRVENQCRDHVLDRLRDRLQPYGIALAVPEARLAEETRVDMLVVTGAGGELPIEVKRHYHPDLWTAASTQLQGYAAREASDGFGIYLVLWFGTGDDIPGAPARPDGKKGPTSAGELENALVGDLSDEIRNRTEVIVFDVSVSD